jgi:hypothetical protein
MKLLRQWWHLSMRFFGAVLGEPLDPRQQDEVRQILAAGEAELFFRQQPIDQRHAFDVARRVRAAVPGDDDAVAAALLHDVGKARSHLGPVARSLATVADMARLPLPERWRAYRDHGVIGAGELAAAGARPLAMALAAGTEMGDPEVWAALMAADNAVGRLPDRGQSAEMGLLRNSMPPEVEQ